jgi:hypothetical protein
MSVYAEQLFCASLVIAKICVLLMLFEFLVAKSAQKLAQDGRA